MSGRNGARGQLLGPHGRGKSTLLFHICAKATAERWRVIEFRGGELDCQRQTLFIVDGVETLPKQEWRRIRECSTRGECGLLVTTHVNAGLPTLWYADVDLPTARKIVDHLLREESSFRVSDAQLDTLLKKHRHNLRLLLFELYDWYER